MKVHTCKVQVISALGLMRVERNRMSSSSAAGSRFDSWIGDPPMVMVEEKASQQDLVGESISLSSWGIPCEDWLIGASRDFPQPTALAEVHQKFRWIPHYAKVDFVFAIAIAGDLVQVEAFSRQEVVLQTGVLCLNTMEGCIK